LSGPGHQHSIDCVGAEQAAFVWDNAERYGRSRHEAYAIASVAADRIHEVVDVPNWVVCAFLPEAIFVP
jgi:acetamidase/formamidase